MLNVTFLQKRLEEGSAESAALAWCRSRAGWHNRAEVDEPCTAVELRVDGLDLPWELVARWSWDGFQDDVAGDLLWGLSRAPVENDGVAVVPGLEDLERTDAVSMRPLKSGSTTQLTYIGG